MQPSHPLHHLADQIERAGLCVPVAILLHIVAPLDVVCSQTVQTVAPFLRGTRWTSVVDVLTVPDHWPMLRDLLQSRLRKEE